MNADYWRTRCEAAEDALRRARSKLMMTPARKKIIDALADVPVGRALLTDEVATRVGVRADAVLAALNKLAEAGFVDRSKKRGHNGSPVRWRLGHMVVVSREGGS